MKEKAARAAARQAAAKDKYDADGNLIVKDEAPKKSQEKIERERLQAEEEERQREAAERRKREEVCCCTHSTPRPPPCPRRQPPLAPAVLEPRPRGPAGGPPGRPRRAVGAVLNPQALAGATPQLPRLLSPSLCHPPPCPDALAPSPPPAARPPPARPPGAHRPRLRPDLDPGPHPPTEPPRPPGRESSLLVCAESAARPTSPRTRGDANGQTGESCGGRKSI